MKYPSISQKIRVVGDITRPYKKTLKENVLLKKIQKNRIKFKNVKWINNLNKINFRAEGFPDELIDNEKEEKGYEI